MNETFSDNIPDLPGWTMAAAAILAPLIVWVLWRGQILGVELLRRRMVKLVRHQKWLYMTVSWFGTFLHEMSHATVLLLSGHGIKQFNVKAESGHVLPRRMHKGPVGFLFFLVAALAPLFGPPLLALGGLIWLVNRNLVDFTAFGPGLKPALQGFEAILVTFPLELLRAISHLDLADGWHLAAFLVILLGIPGSRPSHVKGSKFHGEKDEGDIAVVRKKIKANPWPLLLLLGIVIAAYFPLTKYAPAVYWYPFQGIWAVALTGIILALFGAVWWSIFAANSRITPLLGWVAPAVFVALQVLGRTPLDWPVWAINVASLGALVAAVAALRVVASRRR